MSFKADSPLVWSVAAAANHEPRRNCRAPRLLILHYTGMPSAAKAIDWLARAESRVSCHYVIDENGVITQMVAEDRRAWHAGLSFWRGETDINSASIGIEIQNPGHEHGYPDFSVPQMASVAALSLDITRRYAMLPDAVLAHADVAPDRKIDPGEKFDWKYLSAQDVGLWVAPAAIDAHDIGVNIGQAGPDVRQAQSLLAHYGYAVDLSGTLDLATSKVIRAFQMHFRPARSDGRLDRSTLETLEALIAAWDAATLTS